MNDPRKFKAPYNPKERIWQEADRLRAAHPAGRELPVKILDLAEFDLHLDLIPVNGLREQLDIDALLMGDLKSILVDNRAFMSPRLEYRLRFSVAHEIGHLILHRDIYAGLQHATAAQWFDYISAIPEVEYGWVEWQAYEFAGRLLVPPDPLREAFQAAVQSAQGEPCGKCSTPVIKRKGKWRPSRDYYYEFHLICPKCQTTYHVESAKRFVEQSSSLF